MKYIFKTTLYTCIILGIIYIIFYHSTGSKANSVVNSQQYISQPTGDCPPEGSAVRGDIRALNVLKNRKKIPAPADFDFSIHLKDILQEGADIERWSEHKAIKIQAYVSDVKPGGIETCNCKAKNPQDRDTHIELVLNPMNGAALPFIAEVSPAIRKIKAAAGVDWSTKNIRNQYLGRWVEVEGWLFFDNEHKAQAENTAPGRPRNWRATAWEIHPITSIRIISKPAR